MTRNQVVRAISETVSSMAGRFIAEKYRNDLFGLDYRVYDTEENEVVDDAMSEPDAADLAGAMNRINQTYNHVEVKQ